MRFNRLSTDTWGCWCKKKTNKIKQNKGEEIGALTEEVWLEIAIKWNADVRKWLPALEFKIFHRPRSWKKWATKLKIANHQYHLLLSLPFYGWYGLFNTFTKTASGGLSCVFVVFSFPAIVVDGFKSYSFPGFSLIRIISSTTPASVLLVHGFTHDKSVPYLLLTPQPRSQQQLKFLSTCWRNSPQKMKLAKCCP